MEERTTIIDEILTPTFIALAASVAAATVIVILLIALICHRFYHDNDDGGDAHDHDFQFWPQYSFPSSPNDYDHDDVHDDDHDDDDDDGFPANSPHDKIPPWWEYVINR